MSSLSKKRSSLGDSDSDSDDDFLNPVFATRASKRIGARETEAKKQKRMAQMTALIDSGRIKLEQESRMDAIQKQEQQKQKEEQQEQQEQQKQQNQDCLNREREQEQEVEPGSARTSTAGNPHKFHDGTRNGTRSCHGNHGGDTPRGRNLDRGLFSQENDLLRNKRNDFRSHLPRDTKETMCLGSRNTLRWSRFCAVGVGVGGARTDGAIPKSWSSFDEAMADFRTLLLVDQQQQQQQQQQQKCPDHELSPFAALRKELLQPPLTQTRHAWRYTHNKLTRQPQNLPVDVLRWMMTLACGPMVQTKPKPKPKPEAKANSGPAERNNNRNRNHNNNNRGKGKNNGNNNGKSNAEASSRAASCSSSSLALWNTAKIDAYQTLHRLWSQNSGFPLQLPLPSQLQRDENKKNNRPNSTNSNSNSNSTNSNNTVRWLVSVSDLPHQLHQWFGSTFVVGDENGKHSPNRTIGTRQQTENAGDPTSANPSSSSSSLSPTTRVVQSQNENQNENESEKDPTMIVHVTNTRASLIRFLKLWALALQTQNESDTTTAKASASACATTTASARMKPCGANLVNFSSSSGTPARSNNDSYNQQRDHVSNAILAVLWVGLDPEFASSDSARDECNGCIRTIVRCLLDRVYRNIAAAAASSSSLDSETGGGANGNGNGDGGGNATASSLSSFERWLVELADRLCHDWSTKLGPGPRGTDAHGDDRAWFCLARTVACLEDGSNSPAHAHAHTSTGAQFIHGKNTVQWFRWILSRSILNRAFAVGVGAIVPIASDERGGEPTNPRPATNTTPPEETTTTITTTTTTTSKAGSARDWVSNAVQEEMKGWNLPVEQRARSSRSWQALALALVGLTRLATSFPGDNDDDDGYDDAASRCYAVMAVCTDCFRMGVAELQRTALEHCRKNETIGADYYCQYYYDLEESSPGTATSRENGTERGPPDAGVLEQRALYCAFERLESCAQIVSNKTRVLIMQNICFPWASHLAESLRNYARLLKGDFAPSAVTNAVPAPKQQPTIQSFFKSSA